jgi:hypothetical protein
VNGPQKAGRLVLLGDRTSGSVVDAQEHRTRQTSEIPMSHAKKNHDNNYRPQVRNPKTKKTEAKKVNVMVFEPGKPGELRTIEAKDGVHDLNGYYDAVREIIAGSARS